jgi:GDPmannose 4,6-dehydratase
MTTALITGVTGQDGWYLAEALLARGISVIGLTRDAASAGAVMAPLACRKLALRAFDYAQPGAIGWVIAEAKPDLVFNMASFATGQGMFDRPSELARLNGMFVLDILEAVRNSGRAGEISVVQASSSEMFGNPACSPQDETTPLRPKSPYGAAKQFAHTMTGIYRDAFGLRASSAILFNHESIRRPAAFISKKIARAAARIKAGLDSELRLGSLDIERDWGYAPEYAHAMIAMAMAGTPADYVVATGRAHTIRDLVAFAFGRAGLDWERHVVLDPQFKRPVESIGLLGDPSKIAERLGWRAQTTPKDFMAEMVDHEWAAAQAES